MKQDWKALAVAEGAEIITGRGQFRVGRGAIVTDWCDTEEKAWSAYCAYVGLGEFACPECGVVARHAFNNSTIDPTYCCNGCGGHFDAKYAEVP